MFDDTERWLPVVGYEGIYEVSSFGRVRSLDRVVTYRDGRMRRRFRGVVLKDRPVRSYPYVGLAINQAVKHCYVHTLVCEAFYGPRPSPVHDVRHLNGDPLDNRLENLRWGTKKENQQDTIRHGRNANINKTHCKWGHPYDEENTGHRKSGRYCLACLRERSRAHYSANREQYHERYLQRRKESAA